MFVYAMNFELPEMAKKSSFGLFKPNLLQLGLFHPYFVSKTNLRVISTIKMLIFGSKYANMANFKNKIIENSKIQNLHIVRLLFIKTEIRQVYNPF